MNILIPMVLVWGVLLAVMALGVPEGRGRSQHCLHAAAAGHVRWSGDLLPDPARRCGRPELSVHPSWDSLANPDVWVAAYGQIFFSLSIGFGIMVTYSSYLKP